MNTLLLVDGNALIHRAYHALPPFKTNDGIPTNAVYGFTTILLKAISDFNPSHIVVCFDTPEPTFRNKLHKAYQAHRPKLTDDFIIQIPLVKEMLDKGGVFHLEKDGFEADDLIGTITKKCSSSKMRVIILTGDKDIFQLINQNTFVATPQNAGKIDIYDIDKVKQKFGLQNPAQISDFKALMGDPSDNYKGAKGIGPKTASQLLNQYICVEDILKNIESMENTRIKDLLKKSREEITLGKKLSLILTDVEINFEIDKTKFTSFNPKLKNFLQKLEMYSLVSRIFSVRHKHSEENKKTKPDNQLGLF